MKKSDLTKGFVVFFTLMITFFCGLMPSAWAGCDCCDDQEFAGCYGFSHEGMMMMVNGKPSKLPIPMASVGVFYLEEMGEDGIGKLSGDEMVNFGGISFSAKISGTYRVNPDCTGTAWICAADPIDPYGAIESEISFVITGCNFDEIQMVTNKMTSCYDSNVVVATPLNIVGIAKKQCTQ